MALPTEEEEEEEDKYMLVRKRKPMVGYMNVSSLLLCLLLCLSSSVGPGIVDRGWEHIQFQHQ